MILNSKYGEVKIFAETIEQEAISQIVQMANSPLGENAHIRIQPDCHAGAGCVIGTTMQITNKICPNIVGIDIGCGVDLVQTNIAFENRLQELDSAIRNNIKYGQEVWEEERGNFPFEKLLCWNKLTKQAQETAKRAIGTLGGGNHFVEAYENGYLSVHSGSRNIGYKVAEYYQNLAVQRRKEKSKEQFKDWLMTIEPSKREQAIKEYKVENSYATELSCIEGADMEAYLHDIKIMQSFAVQNRQAMLSAIVKAMGGEIRSKITSTHNYIDTDNMILRKGAISAYEGERLVIPLNMRDGILICRGKGNKDWNCSAPHGAGRLYSRSKAKELFTVEEYADSMKGIYSSCISQNTLDEAPFVYKNFEEIERCIEPTVDIEERLKPIYNFKADN